MQTSELPNLHLDSNAQLHKLGGISAITIAVSYVIIIILYIAGEAPPSDTEEWLIYLGKYNLEWTGIIGLSVLTDFLFLIVSWSLYVSLRQFDTNLTILGVGFIGIFVIVDLAVTWTNYAALLQLSEKYIMVSTEAERIKYATAASAAVQIISSNLLAVYVILVPSIGILLVSVAMLKGPFSRGAAYAGIASGVLGIVSVIGSVFSSTFGMAIIIGSACTTIWVFLSGYHLISLSKHTIHRKY